MDYTAVEVNIKCVSCNCKDVLYLKLEKNQMAASKNWTCPDCHMLRSITVRKIEPKQSKEENEEPVKNYIEKFGKRIQVDENGNPIEKSEQFRITTPKKKEKEDFKEI